MAKFITAEESARLIKDNDVIIFAADGMVGWPNEIAMAVRERFLKEKHPANLTSFRASGMGNFADNEWGEGAWCLDGMLTRTISSFLSVCPRLAKLVAENKVQGYMLPIGPLEQASHEIARGFPGVLTKIGLGTFMDARYGGGKLNKLTEEKGDDIVKYIPDFEGEDYLYYKLPKFNVCLLRGTTADANGNISCEKETTRPGMLTNAQATKTCGGIVIAQVEKVAAVNEIHPRMVEVPGIYVDYIVVAQHPEVFPQTMARYSRADYQPAFTGEKIISMAANNEVMPLDGLKVIARRCAMEVPDGGKVNFGIGMPQNIPSVLEECGKGGSLTMISETGVVGGIPAQGRDFGAHYNPESMTDRGLHFSMFDGGQLDLAIFGLSEMDANGDMNTSYLGGKPSGVGGFTDISSSTKNIIFMGTFTAGGLEAKCENGKLKIVQEGKIKKFIKKCEKVSFVSSEFLKRFETGVLIVTERCVLRYTKDGYVLEEVADGIDIKTQIQDLSEVEFKIPSGGPKKMEPTLFTEKDFRL